MTLIANRKPDLAQQLAILKDASEGQPDLRATDDGLITCAMHMKAIDVVRRTVDFVASTDVVDAHGDVVEQNWHLDDFILNPVILFAHQSRELPIGRAVQTEVRNGQLETKIEFATEDMNPKAEQVWKMIQAKFLRAVSVGFIPRSYRWEMRDNAEVLVFSDNVLKEISVTPVPANPQALAKMKSKALAERASTTTKGVTPEPPNTAAVAVEKKDTDTMDLTALTKKTEEQVVTIAELNTKSAKLEASLVEVNAKLATISAERDALATEKSVLSAQNETLVKERDGAIERATKAEGSLVEIEVDALIGKKITPAEKDMFVELRKSNPALFTKMVEQRSEMNITQPVIATKSEDNGVSRASDAIGANDVLSEVNKLAGL